MRALSKSSRPLAATTGLCALLAMAMCAIASRAQTPAPYDTPPSLLQQDTTQSPHMEILPWKADVPPSCDPPAVVVAVIVNMQGRPMNVHVVRGCGMGPVSYTHLARAPLRCRLVVKMKSYSSRFAFTFRYWQPIAGSADQVHLNDL